MGDRLVPYGFHNSPRVLNSVSLPPSPSQPVKPSRLPLYTHTHYQPPLPKTHNSFSSMYPPPLSPLLPPSSFSLQKANFAEARKPRHDQIQERVSVTEIHQIYYGLYLTLLDSAEEQIAQLNQLWTLLLGLLHWTIFWTALGSTGLFLRGIPLTSFCF